MPKPRLIPLVLAVLAAAGTVAAARPPSVRPHGATELLTARAQPLSARAIGELSPARQARLLTPLRRLAGDLDGLGRARWAAQYTGVELDAGTGTLRLYVTDLATGRRLVAAARRRDPAADWSDVRLQRAAFSAARLDAAARALIAARRAEIAAVAVPVDGSGLDARVLPHRAAVQVAAARITGNGIPVRYTVEAASQPKSWAADKWHDSSPFIGGDVLTSTGHNRCTAGLPAVSRTTGRPVLITAAHCFGVGTRVYTGAGTPGDYGNGLVGNYVGTVTARNTTWDAEELVGANNNADESDTTGWLPLTSVAYSYTGDYVCQDGAASFYLGHPTPCGIKVTDDDLWFPIGGYTARGVEGVDVNGWGSHNGDSGGTVFAVEPGGVRQARGIISSGGLDGTPDQKRVDWTEAVDIFRAFGLKLNPQT